MANVFAGLVTAILLLGSERPMRVELPRSEQRLLLSKQTGIHYKLYISLPPGYPESRKSYPTVYLLDADYSFALAKNISEHLSDRGDLPELVLVGIAYDGPLQYRLNRTRDYTPTHIAEGGYGPEYDKYSGGGPKFREFLRAELIPYIEASYRVSSERTLVGHSYGGLFGAWVLFTQPDLFSSYVLVSPSIWFDHRYAFRVEDEFAAGHRALHAQVYCAVGDLEINEHDMVRDLLEFTEQIKRHSYEGLVLQTQTMANETHNTIFPLGLTHGLRFVYPVQK